MGRIGPSSFFLPHLIFLPHLMLSVDENTSRKSIWEQQKKLTARQFESRRQLPTVRLVSPADDQALK